MKRKLVWMIVSYIAFVLMFEKCLCVVGNRDLLK
jgi:hypothetical protein